MNGDVLTDIDFNKFYNFHKINNNLFSIASFKRKIVNEFGVLDVSDKGKLTSFWEKPINNFLVSMGIYMANKKILDFIPSETLFGFDDLMNLFLSQNIEVDVLPHSGYWLDIGRPDDYKKAVDDFNKKKKLFINY